MCSADGTFLSSINSNSADAVLKTLKTGLQRFNRLPKSGRSAVAKDKIKADFRWEGFFPTDGLALAVYSRDLPDDLNSNGKRPQRWNRDSAWYQLGEIDNLIPKDLSIGDRFPLPEVIARRLLTKNFVDTVRGQTDPFENQEVASKIRCKVTSISNAAVEFSMSGETMAQSSDTSFRRTPRGVVTKVAGSAKFSFTDAKFEQFEIVAVGYRWGRTRFNGRHRGPRFNPLGFVVTLAPVDEAPNVPGLIYTYDADWMTK